MAKVSMEARLERVREHYISTYGEEPSTLTMEVLESLFSYMDDKLREGATLQEAYSKTLALIEAARNKRSA